MGGIFRVVVLLICKHAHLVVEWYAICEIHCLLGVKIKAMIHLVKIFHGQGWDFPRKDLSFQVAVPFICAEYKQLPFFCPV